MNEMHHDSLGDIPVELRSVFDGPRNRYRDVSPPPVAPMLSAFMAMGLTNDKGDLPVTAASNANEPAAQVVGLPKWRTTLRSNKERVMSAIAAFIGTTMGKVVLGTAVAAASVGTGQAVGVLQVPGLPGGATAAVVESEHDDVDDDGAGDAVEAPDCSDQADAIEDAAEGHGDDAEEAASEEADAFEDACEEAAEAAEDTDSGGDEDDSDLEADDDAEADVEDEADEVETEDEVDEPADVEDDADEVETEDEIDEPAEVDDDADEVDDDADEVEGEDEVEDDAGEVEGEDEVDEPADVDDDADEVDTDAAEDGDEAESADIDD